MITYALIEKATKATIRSWTQIPGRIEVADKLRVDGASVGWTDEHYEIVEVETPEPEPVAEDATIRARVALDASDTVLLRCFEADISLPTEWKAYRATLRQIIRDGSGTLPDRPKYPAGT